MLKGILLNVIFLSKSDQTGDPCAFRKTRSFSTISLPGHGNHAIEGKAKPSLLAVRTGIKESQKEVKRKPGQGQ
jgi:hypothetical protein